MVDRAARRLPDRFFVRNEAAIPQLHQDDLRRAGNAARRVDVFEEYQPAAADRACVNTLSQALDLCDALDPAKGGALGVAVDVYHGWWDPQLEKPIRRAGRKRLLAYHICDWLVPTTDLLLDRGMMGDGIVDLRRIRAWMEAAGYQGLHEVEIFSAKNWWRRNPDSVLEICKARHRRFS